ncbi:helix-turn-helix transcriptional regulator [Actinomycetospora flava]|uniref:Helix-turn-helix transcriptional regulator n=1 Tax=Actinomycetospora flava TaxID=3129232 RepID=A0ABU8MFW7_9PSEU
MDELEQAHLAADLGRLVRRCRTACGLAQNDLADAAGVARRTVQRLEHGQHRPRMSLLASLAAVLAPEQPDALLAALVAAAGDSLRPDTLASLRRRARLVRRATARHRRRALGARRLHRPEPPNGSP